ncbi:hypothetical protein MNBD_GAMMA09-1477 [hydrothermal vent metagenome]|uniref:Uncharacterized protein n=1 Tax=hydrothermal vent metagenome TaxID=652676 RepID=A0A3B0YH24_9ZZZZ
MSKQYFKLVLENYQTVSFLADNTELKYRLHTAFVEFVETYGLHCAVLYVKHPTLGWRQVLDSNKRYPIINNPLKLNYQQLIFATTHTLKQADSQRIENKNQLIEGREHTAMTRRHSFYIVKSNAL